MVCKSSVISGGKYELRCKLSSCLVVAMMGLPAALGWVGKLGSSVCLENESILRLPLRMQTEISDQCERESNSCIQLAIISLTYALYR